MKSDITQKEKWKSVPIKELKGCYSISDYGKIKKIGYYTKSAGKWIPNKILSPREQSAKKKYLRITLHKNGFSKTYFIHRLVAMAFVANPENKPHVNHLDGNKSNNYYKNLEWCTPQENNEHGVRIGLLKRGKGSMGGTSHIYIYKGYKGGTYKKIINTQTGEAINSDELAKLWNIKRRYVHRILNEERKPNTTQYRYA